MRIVFIRHGHCNYKNNCLTELGRKQTKAIAQRLSDERPTKIYASTYGYLDAMKNYRFYCWKYAT